MPIADPRDASMPNAAVISDCFSTLQGRTLPGAAVAAVAEKVDVALVAITIALSLLPSGSMPGAKAPARFARIALIMAKNFAPGNAGAVFVADVSCASS